MKQLKISQTFTNRDSQSITRYFNDIGKLQMVGSDEETKLAQKVKEGDQVALEKLIKANLRFVISVAKQYQNNQLPLSDLINEGNLGLIKAAQKFDPRRGFKFISYAVWFIRQFIQRAIEKNKGVIRIPQHKVQSLNKIKKANRILEQKYERAPTDQETAEFLGVDLGELENDLQASYRQTSIDAPFAGDEEANSLLDIMEDPNASKADEQLERIDSLKFELQRCLNKLNDREQQIIKMSFGLGNDEPMEVEDIANRLSLGISRTRQLKEKALRKLRLKTNNRPLAPFLG